MIHTPEQVKAIVENLGKKCVRGSKGRTLIEALRARVLVYLGLFTGMRNGEIRAIQWTHIDGALVHVRQNADLETNKIGSVKTDNSARSIALHPRVINALAELRSAVPAERRAPESFVLGSGDDWNLPPYRSTATTWKRVQAAAGVPVKKFNAMRHYFASILFHKGYAVARVSKMLGHSDEAFTRRVYVHLIDKQKLPAQDVEDIKHVADRG